MVNFIDEDNVIDFITKGRNVIENRVRREVRKYFQDNLNIFCESHKEISWTVVEALYNSIPKVFEDLIKKDEFSLEEALSLIKDKPNSYTFEFFGIRASGFFQRGKKFYDALLNVYSDVYGIKKEREIKSVYECLLPLMERADRTVNILFEEAKKDIELIDKSEVIISALKGEFPTSDEFLNAVREYEELDYLFIHHLGKESGKVLFRPPLWPEGYKDKNPGEFV